MSDDRRDSTAGSPLDVHATRTFRQLPTDDGERDSWLPSDEEIEAACRACVLPGEPGYNGNAGALRKLFERTALRSQIDALFEWGEHRPMHKQWDRGRSSSCPLCRHIEQLRARLAELEGR